MPHASITDKIAGFWRSYLSCNKSILVAVSGGSDSVALVYLLNQLQLVLKINKLAIAHINHGLRGTESDEDENLVRGIASELKIPLFMKRLSGRQLKDPGVELWARQERYRFLHSVMESSEFDFVATGHTADDQAETVIFRILRGAGVKGLRGILPIREDGVIRPLLYIHKSQLTEWLNSRKIFFRNDSSNTDTSLSRNFIRHKLLSVISQYEPEAVDRIAVLSMQMQDTWCVVQTSARKWIQSFVTRDSGDSFTVRQEAFKDRSVASEGLKMLFEEYNIPVSHYHIRSVFVNAKYSRTFLLPGKWQYNPSKDAVCFQKGKCENNELLCKIPVPGIVECRSRNIEFTITEVVDLEKNTDNWSALLDRGSVIGDLLTYRLVNSDDVFYPLGRTGSTNVLRFLAKQGIPKAIRCRTGVIVDESNKVLWIPGIRLNKLCAVKKTSHSVIKIASKILGNNI